MDVHGSTTTAAPGLMALARIFSLARGLFALVGFAAIAVAAHPGSRDWIVRHVVALSQIAGEPAGIGMREDERRITHNTSRFVPHYFT